MNENHFAVNLNINLPPFATIEQVSLYLVTFESYFSTVGVNDPVLLTTHLLNSFLKKLAFPKALTSITENEVK